MDETQRFLSEGYDPEDVEELMEEVNEVDARGYAVMGERSFLGMSGGAIGSPSVLSPVAIQSQKMADLNKT